MRSQELIPLALLGVSFFGAYFFSLLIFKRALVARVTNLKLLGFTISFLLGFIGIAFACFLIFDHSVSFQR